VIEASGTARPRADSGLDVRASGKPALGISAARRAVATTQIARTGIVDLGDS